MLFDTDVLIWVLRGNERAARALQAEAERSLSIINYMELIKGARDKRETATLRAFLSDFSFTVAPLTENIGHRAAIYLEEYALASGMDINDALVAATALENQLTLLTANAKHYRPIKELALRVFKP